MQNVDRPATPVNDIANANSAIGGLTVIGDGGYMLIRPADWEFITSNNKRYSPIDVIRWRMASSFGEQPIAKSGMLGATASRRTGHSYVWEAEVILDLRVQAELILRESFLFGFNTGLASRLCAEVYFQLGRPMAVADTAYPVTLRYYWLPRAKIDSFSPMVEAGDKRRVRYKVAGCANCHCLLLPDQGNPLDGGATVAGAYAQYLLRNFHA
jgi:hypothetical protein